MFRYQCWGLLLIAASTAAGAAPGAIHCGKLLDVLSGRVLTDWVVLFEGSSITAVGPAASTNVPAGVSPIDLAAVTCLPGLIDVHTHLLDDPTDNGYEGLGISVPRGAVTGVKNARITLHAGFTTVRNLNARGFGDVAVRDGINAGEIEGPRMLVSGPALGITGGHADDNLLPSEFRWTEGGIADGPWMARAKVREVVKYGADVIKVMASGGVRPAWYAPVYIRGATGDCRGGAQARTQGGRSRPRYSVHQGCHSGGGGFSRTRKSHRR